MNSQSILILGGYGNTGRCLVPLLLSQTDVQLILAGRNKEKAQLFADQLNKQFKGNRVSGAYADAANMTSLKQVFKDVNFVLVASSTVKYVKEVATAALESGIDYLDIQYSQKKVPILKSLEKEIKKAGLCFITEAGFHPGLPAAMVRFVAPNFSLLEKAIVRSVIRPKGGWPLSDSLYELVEEFKDYRSLFYKDGNWQKAKMRDMPKIDFGDQFGQKLCYPMFLEEMGSLPELFPSIKETGFYIAGFNWFVDWIVSPLMMFTLKIFPQKGVKPMAKLMHWGIKTFSKPPYGVVLMIEAEAEKDGAKKKMEVLAFHEDGYQFTAIPVVACLLQYLDGSLKKPGLWMMGHIIDPNRLVEDMKRMGIQINVR
jgi:saccharopine dehydrogenase-like NADP-dependent oxidoreductase